MATSPTPPVHSGPTGPRATGATRWLTLYNRAIEALTVTLFAGFVCLTSLQVLLRYVFSTTLNWADEVSRYAFIWMVMIAAAQLVQRKGGHITIEVLNTAIHPALELWLDRLANVVIAVFALVLAVYGQRLVSMNMTVTTPATGTPMGLYQLIFVLFGVLCAISAVVALVQSRRGPTGADPDADTLRELAE